MTSGPTTQTRKNDGSLDHSKLMTLGVNARASKKGAGEWDGGSTGEGSARLSRLSATMKSGASTQNSASASDQAGFRGPVRKERSRIPSALLITFAASARPGRRWPSRAPAISTPSISSSWSARNQSGYQASNRRYRRLRTRGSVTGFLPLGAAATAQPRR
jgi:hypothetical protein